MADSDFFPIKETCLELARNSDLECLTLNIALPPKSSGLGPFPVMVWLHGGGFMYGGNEYPIYDGAHFVGLAAERGTPVVMVAMNYRVGIGGFLASRDIQKELQMEGHRGVGNFGLTDQIVGLDWIQRYISQFGGDKDNVSVFGESAGSISIALHLNSPLKPVFHRAICMSGQPATVSNWSLEKHERRYQKILKHFKIDGSKSDALDRLREVPESSLADAVNTFEDACFPVGNPCLDDYYMPAVPSFGWTKDIPSSLRSIMIGHVADEGALFYEVGLKHSFDDYYRKKLLAQMEEVQVEEVMQAYGLSSISTKEDCIGAMLEISSDMIFKYPNFVALHNSPLEKTYAYSFDQPSHIDNALQGYAYHSVELFFLFLNANETMDDESIVLARKFAGGFIDFSYGREPWEPVGTEKSWMVFGPGPRSIVRTEDEMKNERFWKNLPLFESIDVNAFYIAAMNIAFQDDDLSNRDYS